ncbi:MAG TPA: ABC transporter permease [Opitutaceae bacterium]|jgi:predicted permease|nr:ABC transporter permease [Opitutaceae bacterium]
MSDPFPQGSAAARPRESWISRTTGGLVGDVRYAFRRLVKDRGFTGLALLTLALCIGANTAIFSMVFALILKPLPYPEPARVVEIFNAFPKAGFNHFPTNVVQYSDFKANAPSLQSVALCGGNMVMVGDDASAERILSLNATAEMFDVLGLKPAIGQFFTLKNSQAGNDLVVVITESFWKSHYNNDPGVLGKTMRINGKSYQIIGVAPHALEAFDAQAKFVTPFAWKPEDVNPKFRYSCNTPMYARLKPGASVGSALGEVAGIEKHFYDTANAGFKSFLDGTGHKINVGLLQAERVEGIKSSLYLLQGGVIFVLLIGCVNVANLLLTRANGQQSELAIRVALGAGRAAIARQLIVESLILTLAGAGLGVGLAFAGVKAINHFTSRLLPNMLPVQIEDGVLGYTVLASIAVGLLIGLVPVVHTLRSNLARVIQSSSRSSSGGRGVRALSSILVTAQIAFALVLLTGSGLLIHSFAKAISVDPGFDPNNLVVGKIALPSVYNDNTKAVALERALTQALGEIPGVENAALASSIPFEGNLPILALGLKDSLLPKGSPQPAAFILGVSANYFKTLRIPVLKGRFFDSRDTLKDARNVFVVDEKFEQHNFPGSTALDGHFTFGGQPKTDKDWPVIIGVVRNVPHNGVEDKSNNPFVYMPIEENPPGGLNIIVRSSRPVADVISAIREKVTAIDPTIPLYDTGTLNGAISNSFDSRKAVMLLLGGFAALALFLSAIGIYGVIAYDISQRTREIGIRGAIGATTGQITGMVMMQGLWKTAAGLAVGLVCAVLLSHYMESLLFELKPTDPLSYVVVSLVLALVAATACYLPARRASRIDPIVALRTD